MSNPNNGGACFTCSICHRECRCINESVRDGVCVDCYDHIQNTLHDVGGNCFTCSSCHRTCSCCNESVMNGICEECYQIHIYEQQHEFEGDGGNCFKCAICGRQCHCLNESHVDGVCVECIAAASRLGQENNLENIVFCSICHQYKIRGNDETHKGVCSSCYNVINNPGSNKSVYLSAKSLTESSIETIKNEAHMNLVARYLNNEHVGNGYFSSTTNMPYINEHLNKNELLLAKEKNMFLLSIFHTWKKKTVDGSAGITDAEYDAFLAIKLAERINQPSGTTIYFEIPERIKWFVYSWYDNNEYSNTLSWYINFINDYISKLKTILTNETNNPRHYKLGVIYTDDSAETMVVMAHPSVMAIFTTYCDAIIGQPIGYYDQSNYYRAVITGDFGIVTDAKTYSGTLGAWLPNPLEENGTTYNSLTATPINNIEREFGLDSAADIDQTLVTNHITVANLSEPNRLNLQIDRISFAGGYINMMDCRHLLNQNDFGIEIVPPNQGNEYTLKFFSIYQNDMTNIMTYCTTKQGEYDALIACWLCERLGQPAGTPIYFAIDRNVSEIPTSVDYKQYVLDYFDAVRSTMLKTSYNPNHYTIGVYGPGDIAVQLREIYQNDSIHLFLPATSFYSGYDFAINNSTWNIRQYFDTYNNTNYDIDELSDLRSSGCWKVE